MHHLVEGEGFGEGEEGFIGIRKPIENRKWSM